MWSVAEEAQNGVETNISPLALGGLTEIFKNITRVHYLYHD
jgi:hypothetical protein